jgi:hypothetical protein
VVKGKYEEEFEGFFWRVHRYEQVGLEGRVMLE